MSLRCLILPALAALAVAAPAAASPAGLSHSSAEMQDCVMRAATDVESHSATYVGKMRAFGEGRVLGLRFVLQTRPLKGGGRWTTVSAPGFGDWETADPGRRRLVFSQRVNNLALGQSTRALVRFRWRSRDGSVVARAVRRTKGCDQPDFRADLRVADIRPVSATGDGTREYEVTVVNGGSVAAPFSTLALDVGDQKVEIEATEVAAGSQTVEVIEGPSCVAGTTITATADAGGIVDERDETNNALDVPCTGVTGGP